MKALWGRQVIAESNRTREAHGYIYFPRDSVRTELLRKARKTKSDLECPHGVQFYDVVNGSKRSKRAAWSYEAPRAAMKRVDHWFSFWDDVRVR